MDAAALHTIGPVDVRLHAGEERVNATRVEIAVGSCEQFPFIAFVLADHG
jgi:hypothetical protein